MEERLTATIGELVIGKSVIEGDEVVMMKNFVGEKYELTDEKYEHQNRFGKPIATLYRIRAMRDIPKYNVKKGDLGGFVVPPKIEGEKIIWALSQEGDAWVGGNAMILQDAQVLDDALVTDSSLIQGTSRIRREAIISGNSKIQNNSVVEGHAKIENSQLTGFNIMVGGYSEVIKSTIPDRALIYHDSRVSDTNQVMVFWAPRPMTMTFNNMGNLRINCGKKVHKNVEEMLASTSEDGKPLFQEWQKEQVRGNVVAFMAYSRR